MCEFAAEVCHVILELEVAGELPGGDGDLGVFGEDALEALGLFVGVRVVVQLFDDGDAVEALLGQESLEFDGEGGFSGS